MPLKCSFLCLYAFLSLVHLINSYSSFKNYFKIPLLPGGLLWHHRAVPCSPLCVLTALGPALLRSNDPSTLQSLSLLWGLSLGLIYACTPSAWYSIWYTEQRPPFAEKSFNHSVCSLICKMGMNNLFLNLSLNVVHENALKKWEAEKAREVGALRGH